MMDTVSRVESIMALYSGFAQFVENEVPSLARSFLRVWDRKLMKAALTCFPCKENLEELCSLLGTPKDPS